MVLWRKSDRPTKAPIVPPANVSASSTFSGTRIRLEPAMVLSYPYVRKVTRVMAINHDRTTSNERYHQMSAASIMTILKVIDPKRLTGSISTAPPSSARHLASDHSKAPSPVQTFILKMLQRVVGQPSIFPKILHRGPTFLPSLAREHHLRGNI